MKYISSVHHEQVKHVLNLQHKTYRYEQGQFIVEGTRACTQLLETYTPITIYMTEDYYAQHTLQNYEDYIIGVADHVMDKISTTKNPSGICAIFTLPSQQQLPHQGPGLVLIDVSDPGNMGTLLRTAAAMNITQIILVGGVDPYNPKVVQSTAGCMTMLTIHQITFDTLAAQKLPLCALVIKDGTTPEKIDLKNKFLVVGNEAHGLSTEHINICQEKMTIPMPGHAESLNAAVAGAIGLYIMTKN